jgi:hypothetical protein
MLHIAIALSVLGSAVDAYDYSWTCPNYTVLESKLSGWYDGCLGLTNQVAYDTQGVSGCAEQCYKDMNCSIWQMVNSSGVQKCWSGSVVHGCLARNSGTGHPPTQFEKDLLGGERVQHGFVKVVQKNKEETLGLKSYPEATGTDVEKAARCKVFCETDVSCTVWQYGADGCWLEHAPYNFKTGTAPKSTWNAGMIDGETIEHTCPPYVPPEEGFPWLYLILGILAALILAAILAYFLCKKPKKPTPKKKTPVVRKPEVKQEWEELSYLTQGPGGGLIQQRSLVLVSPQAGIDNQWIKPAEQAGQHDPLLGR